MPTRRRLASPKASPKSCEDHRALASRTLPLRPETFDENNRALRGRHEERSVRTSLRANDVVGVKLFAAGQALHDGTIGETQTLGLTGDIRLPAIVWRSKGETQGYQTVATAVGACVHSPHPATRAECLPYYREQINRD